MDLFISIYIQEYEKGHAKKASHQRVIADQKYLDTQLSTSPVASLSVIGNGVTSSQSLPVRHRLVAVLLLGKSSLGSKCLMGWLDEIKREKEE